MKRLPSRTEKPNVEEPSKREIKSVGGKEIKKKEQTKQLSLIENKRGAEQGLPAKDRVILEALGYGGTPATSLVSNKSLPEPIKADTRSRPVVSVQSLTAWGKSEVKTKIEVNYGKLSGVEKEVANEFRGLYEKTATAWLSQNLGPGGNEIILRSFPDFVIIDSRHTGWLGGPKGPTSYLIIPNFGIPPICGSVVEHRFVLPMVECRRGKTLVSQETKGEEGFALDRSGRRA